MQRSGASISDMQRLGVKADNKVSKDKWKPSN